MGEKSNLRRFVHGCLHLDSSPRSGGSRHFPSLVADSGQQTRNPAAHEDGRGRDPDTYGDAHRPESRSASLGATEGPAQ
jgi:hypothetical protein